MQSIFSVDTSTLIVAGLIACGAGTVRGITGFGGAMVMAPPLALLLGPKLAVPVILVLESVAAAPMLVKTRHRVQWKVIGAIILAACVTVPLGVLALIAVDPNIIRRAIAITVILFAIVLLRGWRYAGRPRLTTSVGLGAVSGAMLGATSIGGPPVILYLLSGPDPIETTRANLTLYVAVSSLIGVAMLWQQGVFDARAGWTSLLLSPPYYVGLLAGLRLFPRVSDTRFRQFTLLLLIVVSTGILLA
ncbi:MAG TPA: sulfite exporter TauE/SafE family protein [Burkholderiaceae bacterium]|nr:sulfite exporter TauE/SafE family protein [Burkholderiaceae bacterium]